LALLARRIASGIGRADSAPLAKVCFRGHLGKLMLLTSFSYSDPELTFLRA
jgi:hypothetical protein